MFSLKKKTQIGVRRKFDLQRKTFISNLAAKKITNLKKIKIFLIDHFNLLFKHAKHSHHRMLNNRNSRGERICNLSFLSFSHLEKYQKKVRLYTFSTTFTVVAVFVAIVGIQFFSPKFKSKAANLGWAQTDWTGGADIANFPTIANQGGWTKFFSKDSNVDTSAGEAKLSGAGSVLSQTNDLDFASSANTNVYVSGTGAGASVMLLKANGAACTIGAECASGGCVTTCVPVCSTTTASGQFCAFSGLAYGVVTGADGKLWLDRNLGATRVATSAADANAYGWYYQWGRATDGHQLAAAATTTTLSLTDTVAAPDTNKFIINNTSPYDWRATKNDNLWQGVAGVNNPCPAGYRLPTSAEFTALTYALGLTTVGGTQIGTSGYPDALYASTLKLPLAGDRGYSGSWSGQGSYGYFWSSSPSGTSAAYLFFSSTNVSPASTYYRAIGFSVRCLKN